MFYDSRQSGIFNNRIADVTPFSPQLTFTDPPGPFSNPLAGQKSPFPAEFPPPKNVDFPLPLGPNRPVTLPAANEPLTP